MTNTLAVDARVGVPVTSAITAVVASPPTNTGDIIAVGIGMPNPALAMSLVVASIFDSVPVAVSVDSCKIAPVPAGPVIVTAPWETVIGPDINPVDVLAGDLNATIFWAVESYVYEYPAAGETRTKSKLFIPTIAGVKEIPLAAYVPRAISKIDILLSPNTFS